MDETWKRRLWEAQKETTIIIGERTLARIRYGREGREWGHASRPCHDCEATEGQYHVRGCDVERCPACRRQMITCGCAGD